MADFFLRTPRIIQASEPDSWLGTAPKCQPVKHRRKRRSQQRAPFHLFKLIREANNLILSWRDGLTESQREARRRAEEQMQILAARMQNVSASPYQSPFCRPLCY
jgi:TAG lipase/steryl ester hydrolase/phospholipase A2/LPA acyltransferase